MGTKLRSFSTSAASKVIAFILLVGVAVAMIATVAFMYIRDMNPDSMFVKEYKDSNSFYFEVRNAISDAFGTLEGNIEPPADAPYLYYINNIKNTWTNSDNTERSFFEKHETSFYGFENGKWAVGKKTNPKPLMNEYRSLARYETVYIAFSGSFMQKKQLEWEQAGDDILSYVIGLIAGFLLELLLIIYLILVTGRRPEDRELHLGGLDRIPSDIVAAAFIFFIAVWFTIMRNAVYPEHFNNSVLSVSQIFLLVVMTVFTAAIFTLCGLIFLSAARNIKAGRLIKQSLIYKVLHAIYDFCRSLFDGRMFDRYPLTKSLFYRQMIFIPASFLLVLLSVLFFAVESYLVLLPPVLETVMVYWYIKGNNRTFEDINKGFNESFEEQMRSERMKVALVTNVSHDLKTPLTSIISYVELLSGEENLSDTARDYVKILAEKSGRLKSIVSDLFDLAKSTSGNMPMEMESIDLKKLIEQTLADMDDDVAKSGLTIKARLCESPMNIYADGKKLYRVFQNIIGNALKYSLKGTRVYVELEEKDSMAVATVKNTAGYEMDFTSEEILQRFSRGDKSRTTEGSGLGLSIAESFTQICGGDFRVDIDGDLFKVTIRFRRINS